MENNPTKTVMCRDLQNNMHEVPITKLVFRPSVYGIIIKDDKVLLSKQRDGYDFPGGGIDLGEEIEEALIREVKEEVGLDVTVGPIVHCQDSFFKTPGGSYKHSILMYYLCFVAGGDLNIDGATTEEQEYIDLPEWIEIDKLPEIKLYNAIDNVSVVSKAQQIQKRL